MDNAWNKGMKGDIYKKHYKKGFGGIFTQGHKKGMMGKKHSIEAKEKMSKRKFKGGGLDIEGYLRFKNRNIKRGKLIGYHQFVWCSQSHNLPYIPKGFQIHHIDGNKLNNHPDNLFLMTNSDHQKLHWSMRRD